MYLWNTGHNARRFVEIDHRKNEIQIVTYEPGIRESWPPDGSIRERYEVSLAIEFVAGSWNEIFIGGWDKQPTVKEFVIERWVLEPVAGAFEGDLPKAPPLPIGYSLPLNWPSADWVHPYLSFEQREKRSPPKVEEVIRGGIKSCDSVYLDGWKRFILIASAEDSVVHRVNLVGPQTLDTFLSAREVAWLSNPDCVPKLGIWYTEEGGTHYGLSWEINSGPQPKFYIGNDADNDGVLETLDSHEVVIDALGVISKLYPLAATVSPVSVFR